MIKLKHTIGIVRLLIALLCLNFGTLSLAAQETPAAEAKIESTEDASTLLGTFKQGGVAMYPLLIFSIATFGLILFNSLNIRAKTIINYPVVNGKIEPLLENGEFHKALEVCEQNPGPLINILHNGLETTKKGVFDPNVVDKAFDEAASAELARPFAFINYLQVIASVSPMVGLLGTVSGMVKAFRTIAEQGMGRPELLANNISEALITTASGLMVAIPALIAYFFFKNKYGKIASEVAQILGRTLRTARHDATDMGQA